MNVAPTRRAARPAWLLEALALGFRPHEDERLLAALLHLVERSDLRHPAVDRALRLVCGHRRVRQSLLPDQGGQGRSDPRFRAALGDLQRPRRGFLRAAGLAWLAAPH